ncbi:RNA polymerase sigma factor [Pseudidiomarina mangrovi]|uniref:RNA polymerase sigma factor n=1 Tax=Pseudidiomarina mangrovi TaxID=2487133 RepID=UPI000FCA4DD7|nr:sigma-70 family RNA polymerase sigma factor [Pseudidiomarina mangrovi]
MTAACSYLGQQRFARLHSQLFPKLSSFLSQQIPRQEAEEIAQEALLKVYQRLQTALHNNDSWSDQHLAALTYAIAKNLLVSRARHLKVRWQYHEQQRTQLSHEQPCNAEQAIINDDMHRHLLAAINRLPAICRNVFILRQIHNKRYQDIASELNISIKTVENHLAKGMKLCRQYMIEAVHEESANRAMDTSVCK